MYASLLVHTKFCCAPDVVCHFRKHVSGRFWDNVKADFWNNIGAHFRNHILSSIGRDKLTNQRLEPGLVPFLEHTPGHFTKPWRVKVCHADGSNRDLVLYLLPRCNRALVSCRVRGQSYMFDA